MRADSRSSRRRRSPRGCSAALLTLLAAGLLALLLGVAPTSVLGQVITSVSLIAPDPAYPRVNGLYICEVVMNPAAAAGTYLFTYEFYLQLPAPSTVEPFLYPGASDSTFEQDYKAITSTMATVKHMRLSCKVTATLAADGTALGTMTSAVTTLVNSFPTLTGAEVQKITPRTGSGHTNSWFRVLDTLACVAKTPRDIDDPPSAAFAPDAFYGFFMNFTWSINSVPLAGNNTQLSLGTASLTNRVINSTLAPGLVRRGDTVSCTITPWDSQDWGELKSSLAVLIGVTPPIASGVALVTADSGIPLHANATALCSAASVSSADDDPESSWIYAYGFSWRGVSIANSTEPTLASPGWVRGDVVSCFVRVDVNVSGTVWRGDEVYATITVANSPPVTGAATIAPTLPTAVSNITCSPVLASITDADGDDSALFTFRYLWTRNGITITGLSSNESVLPATGNTKNDVIGCSVSTSDGLDFGAYSPEVFVTVVDSPPTLSNATLVFDAPSAPASITCAPGLFSDPDGDALDGYNVTWFINGVEQDSTAAPLYAAQTLYAADSTYTLNTGQTLSCRMRAVVGGSVSAWVSSSTTLLAAPSIVQFRAYSLENKVQVYALGVVLQLTWSAATNLGILSGTAYAPLNGQAGATMPKSVVDQLFTFSHSLGLDYTGVWSSSTSVLITVTDVRQASPPRIGSTTVSVKSSAQVGFETGSSLISSSTSPVLSGNFGTAPLGYVWGTLSGVDGETTTLPTLFNLSVLGETMIGASAGVSHAFLISSDHVYGIGSNAAGQLGLIDTSIQSAIGFVSTPKPIDSLTGRSIIALASGRIHSLALSDAGIMFVAGSNANGQCGLGLIGQSAGSTTGGFQELSLSPFTGATYASTTGYNSSNPLWNAVVAGYDFSIVYRTAPSRTAEPSSYVYVFGKHFSGSSGYVSGSSNPTPTRLTLPARVVSVAAGNEHVLFLTEAGQVYVWGRNIEGQLGLGASVTEASTPTLLNVVPGSATAVSIVSIYAGALHSFVVSNASVVYCFGRNNDGQCGIRPEDRELFLPTVLPISLFNSTFASSLTAGERASWYTNFNGAVWSFGSNEHFALGIGEAQGETMRAAPTYVAPLAAASIAQVYNRKSISIALTPARASNCVRGCNNHGSCFNNQCQCTPDWTGVECEVPVCASTSAGVCGGHGNCTVVNDLPTCSCYPGFAGESCLAPDCATSALQSCSSHGTCVFQSASVLTAQCSCNVGWLAPTCATCDVGWSGPNCDVLDCSAWDSCSGSQGTCTQVGRLGACVCASGWTGLSCSQPFCTGLPVCSGHGSCISSGGVSQCACDDRFTGTDCQTATCAGSPVCNGQGTCDTSGSSPRCVCHTGFLALDCSIPSCAALNNCNDHGVCITSGGAPSCDCDSNYSGADCSDKKSITSGVIIALIVVAVLVVVILLVAMICFMARRYRNSHPMAGAQKNSFFDPIASKPVRRSNRVSTAPFGTI